MIEQLITTLIEETRANTAAAKENTAALLQVLAASGSATPAPATKKPAKAAKLEVVEAPVVEAAPAPEPEAPAPAPEPEAPAPVEPEPVVEATPEPEADPAPEPEPAEAPEGFNRDEALLEISTTVKEWLKASGSKIVSNKGLYEALRKKRGVANASELDDAGLAPFLLEVREMIASNPN